MSTAEIKTKTIDPDFPFYIDYPGYLGAILFCLIPFVLAMVGVL